jgi:carbamoyl-phosphate synthase small subunit
VNGETTFVRWPAALVFEDGSVFPGVGFGHHRESIAEIVFNTSMSGYQEIVSEPSYDGQIVVMTASQIGNVGCNSQDSEATTAVCAGLVVREISPVVSNWRATESLPQWLDRAGIPGIDDVDTRAITQLLRSKGAMRGAITPHVADVAGVLERVRNAPSMSGLDLVPRVTCKAPYVWGEDTGHGANDSVWTAVDDQTAALTPAIAFHVVAYDFGIKENILRQLRAVGCKVTVVPASTSADAVIALAADGYFLSNGPGDPAAVRYAIVATQQLLATGKPVFGICLGHQILALALGATTYKLGFGHHGGNHPVKDLVTQKVEITAQNHGFAVDESSLPSGVVVSHRNLFDQSVEGLSVTGRPVFSVQYHPEASPGPHDSHYLFVRFADYMAAAKRSHA